MFKGNLFSRFHLIHSTTRTEALADFLNFKIELENPEFRDALIRTNAENSTMFKDGLLRF
jgi:hypothetical protein